MELYPIHMNLAGRRALVVGGGAVAARKVVGLRAAGADVVLVSPDAAPTLEALAALGEVAWRRERYGTGHLDGVFLALACTDDRAVNAQVAREASARGLPVLCADDPALGSFVSPTAVRRGDLLLTVSTGGGSPTLAAVLRERLEGEFGPEWAGLVRLLAGAREALKTIPDEAGRRAAVRRALDDAPLRALAAGGHWLEAETRLRECLSSSSE